MRWGLAIAVLTGCQFHHGLAPGAPDAPSDDADGNTTQDTCLGSFVQVCLDHAPTAPFAVTMPTPVNTDGGAPCVDDTLHRFCVIAGTSITIGSGLAASGQKPLVLFSTSTIEIDGMVDVSSYTGVGPQHLGAAANDASCAHGVAPFAGGGGYGGSFGGAGGTGGENSGGVGAGTPAAAVVPTALRGGCAGGAGSTVGGTAGAGGSSGGAVAVIAATTITVMGAVDASGAGGSGAVHAPTVGAAGGGGGSGGLIVIDGTALLGTGK
ncbi:MAG TPA: hypothetical protein VLX92_10715, partial [Kofleriaceae bacterium]|nr:hypothetical protein [Kofleriaceae bacterium]